MPGMVFPSLKLTVESSAPVGMNKTRFHSPRSKFFRIYDASVIAAHPHPLPPEWGILLLLIIDFNSAIHMAPCDVISPLLQKIDEGRLSHISQISCDDLVIIIRPDPKVFKILRYGVGSSRGFCPFWTIWADAASAMHSSAFFSS